MNSKVITYGISTCAALLRCYLYHDKSRSGGRSRYHRVMDRDVRSTSMKQSTAHLVNDDAYNNLIKFMSGHTHAKVMADV